MSFKVLAHIFSMIIALHLVTVDLFDFVRISENSCRPAGKLQRNKDRVVGVFAGNGGGGDVVNCRDVIANTQDVGGRLRLKVIVKLLIFLDLLKVKQG